MAEGEIDNSGQTIILANLVSSFSHNKKKTLFLAIWCKLKDCILFLTLVFVKICSNCVKIMGD